MYNIINIMIYQFAATVTIKTRRFTSSYYYLEIEYFNCYRPEIQTLLVVGQVLVFYFVNSTCPS